MPEEKKIIEGEQKDQFLNSICSWENTFQTPNNSNFDVEKSQKKQLAYKKWDDKEKELYIQFITDRPESFKSQHLRRSEKVFYLMHQNIPSRTSEQCRSHHQKMMQKHGSLIKITKEHMIKKEEKQKRLAEEAGRIKRKRNRKKRNIENQFQLEEEIEELNQEKLFKLEEDCLDNVPELNELFSEISFQFLLGDQGYTQQQE